MGIWEYVCLNVSQGLWWLGVAFQIICASYCYQVTYVCFSVCFDLNEFTFCYILAGEELFKDVSYFWSFHQPKCFRHACWSEDVRSRGTQGGRRRRLDCYPRQGASYYLNLSTFQPDRPVLQVYDISAFLAEHPGGAAILEENSGTRTETLLHFNSIESLHIILILI